jgi:hypothetical protein
VSLPRLVRAAAGPIIEETEPRLRKESAESAEAAFRAAMARNPGVKTEWRVSLSDALDLMRLSARCADLVVLGQRPTHRLLCFIGCHASRYSAGWSLRQAAILTGIFDNESTSTVPSPGRAQRTAPSPPTQTSTLSGSISLT